MKTNKQKKQEVAKKLNKQILNFMRIDKAINQFGFEAVKHAVNKWATFQRENSKLLREKRALEEKLAEIESKI